MGLGGDTDGGLGGDTDGGLGGDTDGGLGGGLGGGLDGGLDGGLGGDADGGLDGGTGPIDPIHEAVHKQNSKGMQERINEFFAFALNIAIKLLKTNKVVNKAVAVAPMLNFSRKSRNGFTNIFVNGDAMRRRGVSISI